MDPITILLGLATKILPDLAGVVAGPAAKNAADRVVAVTKSVFGTDDPVVVQQKMATDPALLEQYKIKLSTEFERDKLYLADIANARSRDVEVRKSTGGTNTRANVMLIGAFLCLVVIICGVFWFRGSIPDGIVAILNTACGSLLTLLGQAFNFEFGSSRGSAEKTDQLAALVAKSK